MEHISHTHTTYIPQQPITGHKSINWLQRSKTQAQIANILYPGMITTLAIWPGSNNDWGRDGFIKRGAGRKFY